MVGKLIGKSGETIKAMQQRTGSHIQIDHEVPGDHKHVTIKSASQEWAEACKREIDEIINSPDVEQTIECPQGIVGRVIGRGGETIKALQSASQAHIVVNQDFPEGVPRQIVVTGRADSVARAVSMIQELINGEPGSAQAVIQKVWTALLCSRCCVTSKIVVAHVCCIWPLRQGAVLKQFGIGTTKEVHCPKSMVGRVIGKGRRDDQGSSEEVQLQHPDQPDPGALPHLSPGPVAQCARLR